MKNQKIYEPDDSLISIIEDNSNVLQSLGAFGISLGFGNKTVGEVCEEQGVDTYTFLSVVNFTTGGDHPSVDLSRISLPTLMKYLKASHAYYIDFQLPFIRRELEEALDEGDNLARLIMRLYDEYAHGIQRHMQFEEKNLFPYVSELIMGGTPTPTRDIETFSKHHAQIDQKLRELKNIIIKYLPGDGLHNNQLTATLYDIYNNEQWLAQHSAVEDQIFIPVIRLMQHSMASDVTAKIAGIVSKTREKPDALSDRERDVVVCLVEGMSNKEIADHLCISINTVITHRRNIARKLQIHSVAGLTIYAIALKLVDISSVKL